jgi:hypothetical protein
MKDVILRTVSDSCIAIFKIYYLGFKWLRTRLNIGGCEYWAMVPLSVKYMNLHSYVNDSREMTTEPNVGVAGDLHRLGLCMMPHTLNIAIVCFISFPFILPLSSRKQVSIKIFTLLFLLQSVQQIPG